MIENPNVVHDTDTTNTKNVKDEKIVRPDGTATDAGR